MEDLKARWSMSLKAIVYRAHSLGLIDSRQYRAGFVKLSKDGLPELGEDRVSIEQPSLVFDTFELLETELGLNSRSIAERLGLRPELLSSLLGLPEPDMTSSTNIVGLKPIAMN